MDFTKPHYIDWIIEEKGIVFEDGVPLECYRISYDLLNEAALDDWANHIRRHYTTDYDLADSTTTLGISEKEYLKANVIPQSCHEWGPQAIAGEFGEILLYDLCEYILNYIPLRGRHWDKPTPSSPVQGSDVMAVKVSASGKPSASDELYIVEVKSLLTEETARTKGENYGALISAKKDSDKDSLRYSISLDFMRKKYRMKGETFLMNIVARFQQKANANYVQKFIAAGVISRKEIENKTIVGIQGADLKISTTNQVFLIHGEKLMDIANIVYRRIIQ